MVHVKTCHKLMHVYKHEPGHLEKCYDGLSE